MALKSLGAVTTDAGVLVRLTANESDATARVPCHSFMCEVLQGNSARVYIGASDMVRATGVGVYAVLAIPTNNVLPTFSATVSYAPVGFALNDIWLDVDTNGEGVLVSFIEA